MAWQVSYFRRRDGAVPARDFQQALPEALRAKLLRITREVAQSEGTLGGGYYEILHSHPGLSETRARSGRDLGRFICTRDADSLVLLTGVLKATNEPTPEAVLDDADALLAEYRETKDAL